MPTTAKIEAVADACAHLNNVGLPNVNTLVAQLEALTNLIAICDRNGAPISLLASDPRVARAAQSVRDYAVAAAEQD